MAEASEQGPQPAAAGAARRRERLAQTMRENLKRRKAQQRQREAGGSPDAEPVEEG